MRNKTIYLLLVISTTLAMSCSRSDDADPIIENTKSVSDCGIEIEDNTSVSICLNGTDSALPNEIITFASTFYSKNDNPSNTLFLWTIESGNIEILNIENSIYGEIAKSIVTIKFNADYTGNAIIAINAENINGAGSREHIIELESDNL